MAKKFFYVCAGLLMLALSYHFGASAARAQMQGTLWYANRQDQYVAVLTGRTIRWMRTDEAQSGELPPVPGSGEIVQFSVGNLCNGVADGQAILADGSVWVVHPCSTTWEPVGNLLSGVPTSTQQRSWGDLKMRAR